MAFTNLNQIEEPYKPKGLYKAISADKVFEIAKRYIEGENANILAKEYDCSSDTILRMLRVEGFSVRDRSEGKVNKNGHTLNTDAFSKFNEEADAYFYGWLLTDGCMSRNGSNISIELNRKDEEVLIGLKTYLNSSNSIFRRDRFDNRTEKTYSSSSFSFSSKIVYKSLKTLGMDCAKSLREITPNRLKLNRHFWRGVIEGDGHISKATFAIQLVGSLDLLNSFLEFCTFINSELKYKFTKVGKMDTLFIRGKDSVAEILDYIYKDANLKLSRKYETYLEKYCGSDIDTHSRG